MNWVSDPIILSRLLLLLERWSLSSLMIESILNVHYSHREAKYLKKKKKDTRESYIAS